MGSLKLLLSGLLFLSAVALTINENSGSNHSLTDEDRFPYNIIPLHYDINMTLFDTDLIVTEGECKIKIQIHQPTQSIRFHADSSQLHELLRFNILTSLSTIQSFRKVYIAKNVYYKKYNIFELLYEIEIPSGYYVLHLKFRNTEDRNKGNFFRTSYINEVENRTWSLIATDFQAIGVGKLFPCWNELAFRTTFNISIKHHSKYNVLSNMPKRETFKTEQPNMTLTVFHSTPPMPTYHVSVILIMNFQATYNFGVHIEARIQLDFPRYITFAYNVINKVTKHLKSQEKCFEKFTQVKHVAIPGFLHDAVANLGLIYFRETAIIYDEEEDSIIRGTEIARLIGRTLAYQCFDNIIPSWWSYMWLNEGIAMLLGMDAVDEAYPTFRIKDYFVVQIQQESLRLDTDSIMKPLISAVNDLSDIDSVFSYYIKAPVIMRMLQQILTNNVFRKGINMYLNKKVFPFLQITTPDVFWTAMETAYYETREYNEKQLNIQQMMDTWTKQQHYPIVKVIQDENLLTSMRGFIEIMSTREKNWLIPYTIATQMDLNFFLSNRSQQLKMQNSSKEVFFSYDMGKDKWIIVNVQQIGYYRVNYDAMGWENIMRYLNSDEYDKIHVLNRAQIIDDAFYFLMEGHISLTIFVDLAKYLSQERDYIAWYPMIKAFEYMSSSFPFLQSTYIKNIMIKILDVLLKEIGYEKKNVPSSINSLTEEAAKWACTLGSSECKKAASAKLLTDLKKENFSSWMKEWTLCNGLMIQDSNSFWDYLLNIYKEKFDYTILKFLACTECFFKIRNNIELIALNEKTKDDDRIHIFHSIVARHAKNDTTLDYILADFDRVKPRNISAIVALVDIINHVYSKEQLNKITKFLENYQRIRITGFLKHPLIDDRLLKKMIEVAMNNIQNSLIGGIISLFKKKIEMRLSQIMRQIDHFQKLYELF